MTDIDENEIYGVKDIHLLCGLMSALLNNLPSTLFYESKIESFVKFLNKRLPSVSNKSSVTNSPIASGLDIDSLSKLKGVNMETFMKLTQQTNQTPHKLESKSNDSKEEETKTNNINNNTNKNGNETNADDTKNDGTNETKTDENELKHGVSCEHCDFDVASIDDDIITNLKDKLFDDLGGVKNNRYALLSLIFHLFKQVTAHENETLMTCDSLSRIFCQVFESRIFLTKSQNPNDMFRMKYFIKILIFYAYAIFPVKFVCLFVCFGFCVSCLLFSIVSFRWLLICCWTKRCKRKNVSLYFFLTKI